MSYVMISLATERSIYDLSTSVDELTDLAKEKEGARIIRASYPDLLSIKRKLDDILIDFRPAQAAE